MRIAPSILALGAMALVSAGCRREAAVPRAPRLMLGLSPGPSFAVLGATLYAERDLIYRDAVCVGVRTARGDEPAMLEGGRADFWIVGGDAVGHAMRSPVGRYRAAVRTTLAPGTRVAASLEGSGALEPFRTHRPVVVPTAVTRSAPAPGFRARRGGALDVAWQGGDSSHVAIVVTASHGASETDPHGTLLTCVVPRAPGAFTVPAAALAAVSPDADTITVTVAADDRVAEGDYAFDVTPLGTEADVAAGSFGP